ncbi:FixJ family two-component response regulator [Azospirillum sp. OGB3]|uniref:response regulator transcription factor n=1 Tax=Azospirillum sp. OGB3 TaxID=2587012 RepID=UPI001605FE40|nr:response regulator [Azospirillum sp. OGB3]MBB3268688.1 FixJ family two-component response regulator [Azospirillum sp. OGB3]
MEPTVHIVDDDPALRRALTRLCRAAGLTAVEHSDANGLAEKTLIRPPSCILLDVRLADQNGLVVQEALRDAGSSVPIIFLTGYGTIPMTVRAMRGGAIEFLTKPVEESLLLDAINRAIKADTEALDIERARHDLAARRESLTDREHDVMACVIGGLMNKQIAGELGISEITAKVHKRHVMEKMGARSLPDLVRMAEQLGISARRRR